MDEQSVRNLIIFFLFFRFIILPICSCIICIIKLLLIKNNLKNAGINYYKMDTKENSLLEYIIICVGIIIILFLFFSGAWLIPMIGLSYFLYFSGELISNKIYGNISGIYKNGIIIEKNLIKWDEINSYIIRENNIFGYFKNDKSFEFENLQNINKINELFEKNNIMKIK